jgi:uncharacterized protein with FMN-binding domain
MKKWILVGALVLIFTAFAVYQHVQGTKPTQTTSLVSDPTVATLPNNSLPTGTIPESSNVASNSQSSTSTTPTSAPATSSAPAAQSSAYKDGTYTGSVENAFYGNLQVAAVISGGKISAVNFLQYPNDRGTSKEINAMAMPLLQSEAIQAQSANVDVVSGATQSSQAFAQSLATALNQAK